jgi:hypothetical protein
MNCSGRLENAPHIGMRFLLHIDRKVQRLEGKRPAPVQLAQKIENALVHSYRTHVTVELPHTLDTAFVDVRGDPLLLPHQADGTARRGNDRRFDQWTAGKD